MKKIVRIVVVLLAVVVAIGAFCGCAKQQPSDSSASSKASLKKEDVEAYNGPMFVVRYTNDAWGFVEEFTLYDSNGKIYVYKSGSNKPIVKNESDLVPGLVEKMRQKGVDVSGSKKYSSEDTINKAWLEAIKTDFDSEKSEVEHKSNNAGTHDIYVFDTDEKAHWIMRNGDEECQLKDEHVSATKGLLKGD